MSHANSILAAAVALALLGSGPAVAQKKLYCWNENGKKVCGDALPAEASDSARTEISASSGLRTGQVSRALTDAERSAAAVAADAARRQAEAAAMEQRRDSAMVESYVTESDLRRAYGERTELLDETLKASTLGLSNLRLSLLSLLRQWKGLKAPLMERRGLLLIALSVILGTLVGMVLSMTALKLTQVAVASILMSLMPVMILPIEHFLLKKRVRAREALGALLTLLGVGMLFL